MKIAMSGKVLTFEGFIEFTEQVADMVHKSTIDKLQRTNADKRRALLRKNDLKEGENLMKEIDENEIKIKHLLGLTEKEMLEKFWAYLGLCSPVVVRV